MTKREKRLILLDYDGTLTAFKNHPEDAATNTCITRPVATFMFRLLGIM